jgi:hypothetical protein
MREKCECDDAGMIYMRRATCRGENAACRTFVVRLEDGSWIASSGGPMKEQDEDSLMVPLNRAPNPAVIARASVDGIAIPGLRRDLDRRQMFRSGSHSDS